MGTKKRKATNRRCKVKQCARPHYALGLCEPHYQRRRESGTSRSRVPIRQPLPEIKAGDLFGRLTAIAKVTPGTKPDGKRYSCWRCVCVCGNVQIVPAFGLKNGTRISCGCAWRKRPMIRAGDRFGRLTTVWIQRRKPNIAWLCQCQCGGTSVSTESALRAGEAKSCGCLRIDANRARFKHGLIKSSEYNSWAGAVQRATNPNNLRYTDYGGRGISVCQALRVFITFYAVMGPKPEPKRSYSIDRKDNDGGYWCGECDECLEKGWPMNVHWATAEQQSRNKRPKRKR